MLPRQSHYPDHRSFRSGRPLCSNEDPLAGTGYRTVSWLGQGGMSEVFVAEHLELRSSVVVKLLHSALAERADLAERMRVEGQSLALLRHPNVVQVIDAGQTRSGRPFLVMEHLIGRTLGAELRARGALPCEEAVLIVQNVLAGLAAAHALGIVHRDIKVENIFLHQRHDGTRIAKILDFGVAKVVESANRTMPQPLSVPTRCGSVVGTPGYLSPEQALGMPADQRSDLYAVAVVFYKLITGRGPFDEFRGARLIEAHIEEPPRPPSWFAKQRISGTLDGVVLKALRKEPDQRFQTAAELAVALEGSVAGPVAAPLRAGRPPPAPARGAFSANVRAIALLAIVSGLTGGLVAALAASVMARILE